MLFRSTASYASTMHFLTGGRFALGLGRGIDLMFKAFGLPKIKTAELEDFAGLMRRLWRGETIVGHNGPAGSWPLLRSWLTALPVTSRCVAASVGRVVDMEGRYLRSWMRKGTTSRGSRAETGAGVGSRSCLEPS